MVVTFAHVQPSAFNPGSSPQETHFIPVNAFFTIIAGVTIYPPGECRTYCGIDCSQVHGTGFDIRASTQQC